MQLSYLRTFIGVRVEHRVSGSRNTVIRPISETEYRMFAGCENNECLDWDDGHIRHVFIHKSGKRPECPKYLNPTLRPSYVLTGSYSSMTVPHGPRIALDAPRAYYLLFSTAYYRAVNSGQRPRCPRLVPPCWRGRCSLLHANG
jgi:hypothetical protein